MSGIAWRGMAVLLLVLSSVLGSVSSVAAQEPTLIVTPVGPLTRLLTDGAFVVWTSTDEGGSRLARRATTTIHAASFRDRQPFLEYHPNNPVPSRVLLKRLAADRLAGFGW